MNPFKGFQSFPGLVGLQVPNKMPCDRGIPQLITLGECFLQPVFTDVRNPGIDSQPDAFDGDRFGNGDQTDGTGVPSTSDSCLFYRFKDSPAVLANIDHLTLSGASSPA